MLTTVTRPGLLVSMFIVACAPRSDARPQALAPLESEDASWLEQVEADLRNGAVEVAEPNEAPLYPSLAALARAEQWECGARPVESCVRNFGTVDLKAPGELRSVHLLGVPTERMVPEGEDPSGPCAWRLVTRSEHGWLSSIWLGNSPAGCERTLDAKLGDLGGTYWFPLALSGAGDAVRIEGQGQTTGELWSPEVDDEGNGQPSGPSAGGPRRIDHVVHLCRVARRALACSQEATPGRQLLGALTTPLATTFTTPLSLAPEVLPLARVDAVGRLLAADWVGLPTIGDQPIDPAVAHAYTRSRMLEWRIGDGVLFAIISETGESMQLLYQSGGVSRRLRHFSTSMSNESQRLVAVEATRDVVHLTIEKENHGPATVAWRWEVLVVAPAALGGDAHEVQKPKGPHVFIVPSGISLAEGSSPASGWRLDVEVEPGGVHISEADGPLAWFRETGRFTWPRLVAAIPRWRARLARALRLADALVPPRRQRSSYEGKEVTAEVLLLPGYVEPLESPCAPVSFEVPIDAAP